MKRDKPELETMLNEYQVDLLIKMAKAHPDEIAFFDLTDSRIAQNAHFLEEQGLIACTKMLSLDDQESSIYRASLTFSGRNYLSEDAPLTNRPGDAEISLHVDTLKALIAQRIDASSLSTEEKIRWHDDLRKLDPETTKQLVLKLIDQGLSHAGEAIRLIGKSLSLL